MTQLDLRNAPATFQRLVYTVLSWLTGCEAYLDDIVVYSNSWQDHIQKLHEVFGRLRDSKVEAILSFPVPPTRRALQRFLGMASYYKSFCKNFSDVAALLTDLLSPKRRFQWSPKCQHAFDCLKALLTNVPVLAAPAFDRPFNIAVDASDVGAGAVLLQEGDDGVEHPVSYYSKKFKSYERKYSTIEKEGLPLILALKHFEFRI